MRWIRKPPLLVVFGVAYTAAQAVLLSKGNGTRTLLEGSILLTLCLLTRWFTHGNTSREERAPAGRLITMQMVVIAVIIVAMMLDGAFINHITPAWARVPLWSNLHDVILAAAAPRAGMAYANGLANLAMYCVPIAVVLLLLGIPLAQQGFGRFRCGSLASCIAWLLPLLSLFAVFVITGRIAPMRILRSWLSNLLQDGVSEEFFWRGAVLGRLRALMSVEHALYLQALLFGLSHFFVDYPGHGGDVLGICAEMIVNQMTFGLALGYVTLRTGNIAIGSVFHLLWDSATETLG